MLHVTDRYVLGKGKRFIITDDNHKPVCKKLYNTRRGARTAIKWMELNKLYSLCH